MFEDKTYENLMAEALKDAPPGVDTRQGSIYYDAMSGACQKIAEFYVDLKHAFELVHITSAVDEYLDEGGAELGVNRNPATSARYKYYYEGLRPPVGERFLADGKYFRLGSKENVLYLEAEETGKNTNNVMPGTPAVPVKTVSGLIVSLFGELWEPGVDDEDNEDYRERISEKVAGPAQNGNRQHYKTWCESDSGVGRARIIPLWDGDNTVKGVLIGVDGLPAAKPVVERVQEFIDPGGTGLGDGVANIGAYFTAVAAEALSIIVSFSGVLSPDSSEERATEEAAEVVKKYFKDLALNTPENEIAIARISAIGALLHNLPSIIDYNNLLLNGENLNIQLDKTQVAVLEEVVVSAVIR